jgi:hypothetical protein
MLAGTPIADLLELARRLREAELIDTAEVLEDAYYAERRVVALTIADREAVLRVARGLPGRVGRATQRVAARARVATARRARLATNDYLLGPQLRHSRKLLNAGHFAHVLVGARALSGTRGARRPERFAIPPFRWR